MSRIVIFSAKTSLKAAYRVINALDKLLDGGEANEEAVNIIAEKVDELKHEICAADFGGGFYIREEALLDLVNEVKTIKLVLETYYADNDFNVIITVASLMQDLLQHIILEVKHEN